MRLSPRMRLGIAVWCVAMALCSCARHRVRAEASVSDPRALVGHWALELRSRSPFTRLPLINEPEPWVFGHLELRLLTDTAGDSIAMRDSVAGRFYATLARTADTLAIEFGASARMRADGTMDLILTFPGRCPCATMDFVGLLADGEVNGQTRNPGGEIPNTRFRMRRR